MIDLRLARANVSDSLVLAQDLDGVDVDDTDAVQNKRRFAADVSRDLLRLADQLELASALVRNEYWKVKGYSDSLVEL